MGERWPDLTFWIVGATVENLLDQQIRILRQMLFAEIKSVIAKPAQDVETTCGRIETHAIGQATVPEGVIRQDQCN